MSVSMCLSNMCEFNPKINLALKYSGYHHSERFYQELMIFQVLFYYALMELAL